MTMKNNGAHVSTLVVIASMVTVVLLVVGVAVLVYFASERGDKQSQTEIQRWDECEKSASSKGLCMVGCKSTSTASKTTRMSRPTTMPPKRSFRLPRNVKPKSYDLILTPYIYGDDPSKFYFDGEVAIQLDCNHATDVIVLHSTNLTYQNDSIHVTPSDIRVVSHSFDREQELVYIYLNRSLQVGQRYIFQTKYRGLIWSDNLGLYISSYETNGRKQFILGSQLSPTYARRILPCFDEPDRKASFTLTVNRWSNMTCLSNMESTTVSDNGTWARDKFYRTPVMSTYLLALVIGKFSNRTDVVNGITISTWTRPTFDGQQQYALDIAKVVLPNLAKFYGVPYPLKKLDMLAIPDFYWGAMENWGLVLYRESTLLYDQKLSSALAERRVAYFITHELAHMWFGNLVTMTWWDHAWLKEGFAAYIEDAALDEAKPKWRYFENFRTEDTEFAMKTDSYKSSHPLHVPINVPKDIIGIFDAVTYKKGAHVIKMTRFFLGEKLFQNGLQAYLYKYKYKNAQPEDLWNTLGEVSGQDVKAVLSTWVMQMNFPLVHIKKVQTHDGGSALELTQERYILDSESGSQKYSSPYRYRWRIPMSIISNSTKHTNNSNIMWMNERQRTSTYLLKKKLEENAWILGNPDNNVFCRVNYDNSNWRLLIGQLKDDHTKISTIDRTTLLHDACHLARAGRLNTTICLDVLSYLSREKDFPVLVVGFSHYKYMRQRLHDRRVYSLLSLHIQKVVGPLYKTLAFNKPNASIQERDKTALGTREACRYGIKLCLDKMQKELRKRIKHPPEDIDPNVMKHAYCYGIQEGTPDDWWSVYRRLEKVTALEKSSMIDGLACTRDVQLLRTYLELGMKEMRQQDLWYVVTYVAKHPIGRYVAFNFVRENWDALVKLVGANIYQYVADATSLMNTQTELDELRALMAAHPDLGHFATKIKTAVRVVTSNVEWIRKNEDVIYGWLKERYPQ